MSDLNAILHQALVQHQAGKLRAASGLYHQILVATPPDPDALHLLGIACAALGDSAQAFGTMWCRMSRPNHPQWRRRDATAGERRITPSKSKAVATATTTPSHRSS